MLKRSFVHIPRISKQKEFEFWKSGILTWDDFLDLKRNNKLKFNEQIEKEVMRSIEEYEKKNFQYFTQTLPKSEHWRMYPHLKNKCCFLDIETTGLNKSHDIITMIGLYDGSDCKIFVSGKNMNAFAKEIKKYDMVVTFNGACFDLPFIRLKNENISLPNIHVDLRFALRRLGYTGGLKNIENELGINRHRDIRDMDGFEAVKLWKAYEKGNKKALSRLISYNSADVKNLKPLMELAFEKLCEKTFPFH